MAKLSVLIDLDRLKDLNTGLGQVALFFGRELVAARDDRFKFTFLVPARFKGYFGNEVDYEVVSPLRRYLPGFCRKYDLWYALHQDSAYYPSDRTTPYVLTIHDLNFLGEKSPEKAKARLKILQRKVNRASAIAVISRFTEAVVRKNLNLGSTPVYMIYNGVEVRQFDGVPKPAFVPDGELLFSIGVVQMKKNQHVLLDFMLRVPDKWCLVIAGNKSSDYAEQLQREIQSKGLAKRVVMPGVITEEEKCWLYSNCKAILFPSRFEGMGLPPIEAMRFGKPVFASNLSSIPEVCGENAYYWESFDADKMAELFLSKLAIFEQDAQMPAKLRHYSESFSWQKNVQDYLNLFARVIRERQPKNS